MTSKEAAIQIYNKVLENFHEQQPIIESLKTAEFYWDLPDNWVFEITITHPFEPDLNNSQTDWKEIISESFHLDENISEKLAKFVYEVEEEARTNHYIVNIDNIEDLSDDESKEVSDYLETFIKNGVT